MLRFNIDRGTVRQLCPGLFSRAHSRHGGEGTAQFWLFTAPDAHRLGYRTVRRLLIYLRDRQAMLVQQWLKVLAYVRYGQNFILASGSQRALQLSPREALIEIG